MGSGIGVEQNEFKATVEKFIKCIESITLEINDLVKPCQ